MSLNSEQLKALCQKAQDVPRDQVKAMLAAFAQDETRLDAVRLLRNCSALNPTVKEELLAVNNLEVVAVQVIKCIDNVDEDEEDNLVDNLVLARCTLQFISNLANGENAVLQRIANEDIITRLQKCLRLEDFKAKNFSASVILLLAKASISEVATEAIVSGLCAAVRVDSEFALFALQTLTKNCEDSMTDMWTTLPQLDKLTLIDIYTSTPLVLENKEKFLSFLLEYYKQQASQILTTLKNNSVQLAPNEFTRMLGLFCELTATEEHRLRLQNDKSLLIDTVYLLRMIHEVGQNSPDSIYAPTRKLGSNTRDSLESQPAHGFKRDLVRLIGNLCWDHAENKDDVRDMDGIPLLMDCTSIDGKNPFMGEWVIFTLRNLCKNNQANQDVVNGVSDKGLISVELAKEYGVEEAIEKMEKLKKEKQ